MIRQIKTGLTSAVRSFAFVIGCAAASVICAPAHAMKSFVATCEDVNSHSYRSGTDILGKRLASEWTDRESFFGTPFAMISYIQGDRWVTFLPEGRRGAVVAETDESIAFIDTDTGAFSNAVNVRSYAVNGALSEVVYSDVQSVDGPAGRGLRTRATQLRCELQF